MDWKEALTAARRAHAMGIGMHGEALLFDGLSLDEKPAFWNVVALVETRATQVLEAEAREARRAETRKGRLDRRYARRHGVERR